MRERDDGGGRPQVRPMTTVAVEGEYHSRLVARTAERDEMQAPPDADEAARSPLFYSTFTGLVVLLGGILILYLYAQTVVLVGTIFTYPAWVRAPALGFLGLLVAIILWSILRLVASYYRLLRNRQIRLDDIRLLNERQMLEEATARKKEAKAQLIEYLNRYDLDESRFETTLMKTGMTPEHIETIGRHRRRLLTHEFEDTQRWLEEFRDGFQGALDGVGEQIIGRYMKRIGIATAAVPKGLLDALIVTWGSMNMLRELCAVYNLRLGRIGTLVLLGRVFRNVFIAGEMSDVTTAVVQDLSHRIHDGLGVASDAFTNVAATAGGKVLGKASEGLVNALLIRRLGYGARKMLRPCAS